eukprot:2104794-Alexandrium_andersonii.AAC.1
MPGVLISGSTLAKDSWPLFSKASMIVLASGLRKSLMSAKMHRGGVGALWGTARLFENHSIAK